jgi:hypothetical protein
MPYIFRAIFETQCPFYRRRFLPAMPDYIFARRVAVSELADRNSSWSRIDMAVSSPCALHDRAAPRK